MAQNCKNGCIDLSFPATEAEASAGIADLSHQLMAHGVPTDRADGVKIALAEAINNVVEHAYAGLMPDEVRICCRLSGEFLEVEIVDTGNPMPGLQPPDGPPPTVEVARKDLPEGGFGWFMIHNLASAVRYERHDGFNRLCLSFRFSDAS